MTSPLIPAEAIEAAAKDKAEAEGVGLSEIIRQALQAFVDRDAT